MPSPKEKCLARSQTHQYSEIEYTHRSNVAVEVHAQLDLVGDAAGEVQKDLLGLDIKLLVGHGVNGTQRAEPVLHTTVYALEGGDAQGKRCGSHQLPIIHHSEK